MALSAEAAQIRRTALRPGGVADHITREGPFDFRFSREGLHEPCPPSHILNLHRLSSAKIRSHDFGQSRKGFVA
jgi:hypothetical protein